MNDQPKNSITFQGVLIQNAVIMCAVFILLQYYFGGHIVHIIKVLQFADIILNAFANLLCSYAIIGARLTHNQNFQEGIDEVIDHLV